jgi:hypothetical protein
VVNSTPWSLCPVENLIKLWDGLPEPVWMLWKRQTSLAHADDRLRFPGFPVSSRVALLFAVSQHWDPHKTTESKWDRFASGSLSAASFLYSLKNSTLAVGWACVWGSAGGKSNQLSLRRLRLFYRFGNLLVMWMGGLMLNLFTKTKQNTILSWMPIVILQRVLSPCSGWVHQIKPVQESKILYHFFCVWGNV